MGVIQKQAIKNTVYSYLGVVLGFLTAGVLFPHILTADQNGLLKLLVSFAGLFAMFANLGFNNVTTRFFPYFRNKEKKHHGFLFYNVVVSLVGFLLCCIFFYLFKDEFIARNLEKSKLFTDYLFYLLPLAFFTLYFTVLDVYARAVYSSVVGTFLKEFVQRILIILTIVLYYFEMIGFETMVFLYVASMSLPTIILTLFLIGEKELGMRPNLSHVDRNMARGMISLSMFSVLTGLSSFTISNIDSVILNDKLGIGPTGIYSIMFYFGALIAIPARSIYRISSSVIAEAMKNKDMDTIYKVYHKSCISQLLIGTFLFLMVWCNIDTILRILPPHFAEGKYVIFFIGLGNIFEMATGVNGLIVANSKYYRYDTLFMIFLIGVAIATNLVLIPIYGITGSAIASAIAMLSFNAIRYLFILVKFKMQPFDKYTVKVLVVSLGAFFTCYYIPTTGLMLIDGAARCGVIATAFWILIVRMKVSEEIYLKVKEYAQKVGYRI